MWSANLSKGFSQLTKSIFNFINHYPISELAPSLCFPADILHTFSLGGASWTLDPSKEVVNCKIKHANNKSDV